MQLATQQTSKDPLWYDEAGNGIPYKRLTASERQRELAAHLLMRQAYRIHLQLNEFKQFIDTTCAHVTKTVQQEHKIKTDSKGNFTWYNFNRSIKIEVNISNLLQFDETLIDGAKQMLTSLINDNITGDDFIKSIVLDAFSTSHGKLDTKRVLGLKKHTKRITTKSIKEQWQKAMELIDQAVSRPDSRKYFRIWVLNDLGDYENINLNFSSI